MSNDAPVYYGTWSVVTNNLSQRFLTRNVLKKARSLLTWAAKRTDEEKQNVETRFHNNAENWRHIFSAMENTNNYVRGLKPSIHEELLEKL